MQYINCAAETFTAKKESHSFVFQINNKDSSEAELAADVTSLFN